MRGGLSSAQPPGPPKADLSSTKCARHGPKGLTNIARLVLGSLIALIVQARKSSTEKVSLSSKSHSSE